MTIVKKYWDSVYAYILLVVPLCCICAGIYFTTCRLLGYYSDLSWTYLILFDITQLIYLGISIYYIIHARKDSFYIFSHMIHFKGFMSSVMIIQYFFILAFFPSDYLWECTFIFMAASIIFFDFKLMCIHGGYYTVFLFIASLLKPEVFFPLDEPNYKERIAFRLTSYFLTLFLSLLVVYLAERFLIQSQEKEEENLILLEKQVDYYKNTELMDMELRKFRHDIINHFACMKFLLNNNNIEELNTYFQDLETSFTGNETIYFSGNHIIDAVLNNDLTRHCKEFVEISIHGSLTEISTVSSIDLCTLFSNLLSNAINSVNQCPATSKPELSVNFHFGKHYFSIIVINSIDENRKKHFKEKHSVKKDRNHGFGLGKIKDVVHKYNGRFEQQLAEDKIITEVYLPL